MISANVSKTIIEDIEKLTGFRNFSHRVETLLSEALKARGVDVHSKLKQDGR